MKFLDSIFSRVPTATQTPILLEKSLFSLKSKHFHYYIWQNIQSIIFYTYLPSKIASGRWKSYSQKTHLLLNSLFYKMNVSLSTHMK